MKKNNSNSSAYAIGLNQNMDTILAKKSRSSFLIGILILSGSAISCTRTGFNGAKKTAEEPAPQPAIVPPQNTRPPIATQPPDPLLPKPSDCTDDGQTVAQSLTNKVLNGKPNQLIAFQLSLKDCYGKERFIQANEIRFDFNAFISTPSQNIFYKLKTKESQVINSGQMDKILGEDLFGNKAGHRFYYKTVGDLRIPPGTNLLFLDVDVSNLVYHIDPNAQNFPPIENIEMYFAFGSAQPVKMTIMFEN